MSSGLVSIRTKMTLSPRLAADSASSAENTTLPEAAPGEAGSVPGYEFEGRRSAPGRDNSSPPGEENGRADLPS